MNYQMKEEILDQIDSLMQYPYFEFNLSKQNDNWNNTNLNWKAKLSRKKYCEKKNLTSWEQYVLQQDQNNTYPDTKNFDFKQWEEIIKDVFENSINELGE